MTLALHDMNSAKLCKDAPERVIRAIDSTLTKCKKSGNTARYETQTAAVEEWLMERVDASQKSLHLSDLTRTSLKHRRRGVTERYRQRYLNDVAARRQWLYDQMDRLDDFEDGMNELVDNLDDAVMEDGPGGYKAVERFELDHHIPERHTWV